MASREPSAAVATLSALRRLLARDFFAVYGVLTLAGIARQLLDAAWGHFPLTLEAFVNTITYVYLMVIAEGFVLHLLLNGTPGQLRELVQRGAIWIGVLFVQIPLVNIVFHELVFQWPVWHPLDWLPFPHFPHYGPVGIHMAAVIILLGLPFLLRRIYPGPLDRIFAATVPLYAAHYLVYYQVTMWLYCRTTPWDVNAWSASFLVPLLVVFPYFASAYAIDAAERRRVQVVHALTWVGFLILCVV